MKIEKLSENQIRCTLNRADLASRQLKISELAYGSEKAKALFREMMQQASYEFGFEAEDIPLMIEAIPMSPDCIVLIITKVEDPDELDTRFSKFSPSNTGDDEDDEEEEEENSDTADDASFDMTFNKEVAGGADEIINLFNKVKDYLNKNLSELNGSGNKPDFVPFHKSLKDSAVSPAEGNSNAASNQDSMEQALLDNLDKMESIDGSPKELSDGEAFEINMIKLYSFNDFKSVNQVAAIIGNMYNGENSLYHDSENKRYYLQISKSNCDAVVYNKICNILSEYGIRENNNYARSAYLEENYKPVIKTCAIQTLAKI